MNLGLISYQCMKGFTSEDAYIVIIMIIPKLLLLLPLLLLAEAQNDSQRNRLRRPVITPGFRPESTLSPIINTPIITKQIPEFVEQQYVPTSTINNEKLTTKLAETQEPSRGKVGFTIIFSNSYTDYPITASSTPSPPSTSWIRPITRPENIQTPSSTAAPITSTEAPITSTKAPSTLNVVPPTSGIANVDVAAKIPPANQELGDRRQGFTIIFSDNYTKVPTTVNSSPVSAPIISTSTVASTSSSTVAPSTLTIENVEVAAKIPPENQESENKKPGFTVIFTNTSNTTQKTVYIPTQTTNLPPKKPTESYSIIIIKNKDSDSNVNSQPIADSPQKPDDSTTAPLPATAPLPPARRTITPVIITTTREPPTTWTTSTTLNPQTTWDPSTQSVGQLRYYICKDVNGYYTLENKCGEYILCKNNTAYKNMCPEGLHFNPVARYPANPCAYPTEVKCQNPSIKQLPQPSGECPHRFGHFPMPNGDCGHFMVCQEGAATIMPCPPGLAFNEKLSVCDWSINVPGCNPSAFEGFTCPAVKSDIYGNSMIINYGYKNSCKNYIACHEGHPRLLSCDAGLSFDEATAKCVESNLVRNCKS